MKLSKRAMLANANEIAKNFKGNAYLIKSNGAVIEIRPKKRRFMIKELYEFLNTDMVDVRMTMPYMNGSIMLTDAYAYPGGRQTNFVATSMYRNHKNDCIHGDAIICDETLLNGN